ncbi:MAG: hypothetical protein WD227_12165 [Vicinamibacterales bacterium]
MAPSKRTDREATPAGVLENLATKGVALAKKARKHRKSLRGDNFYANKLADLRADATNAYRQLSAQSAGDSSALAELVETVFSPDTAQPARLDASRELAFAMRTTALTTGAAPAPQADGDLFPLAILSEAGRGYLVTVGRQMNGCFERGWFDAAAVMMRRLLEICIIEAFEAQRAAAKITGTDGNYFQLTDLVNAALAEPSWTLSRNCRKFLPRLKDVGHQSAHGRYYHARAGDIEALRPQCRVVIEEFLHHADLL